MTSWLNTLLTSCIFHSQAYETSTADAQSMIDGGYYGVLFWAFDGGNFGRWDGIYKEPINSSTGYNKFPSATASSHSTA